MLLSARGRIASAIQSRSSPLASFIGIRPLATKANEDHKAALVSYLLEAKKQSGLSFDAIAKRTGLTNAYVAQLFHRQAHLKPDTVAKLSAAVPTLSDEDLELMQEIPFRTYDRDVIRTEPLIYRLEEGMLHYGQSIKSIVNEKLGDGIISAIDLYLTVDVRKGPHGENRVVMTFDGKFLPFTEQHIKDASPAAQSAAKLIADAPTEVHPRGPDGRFIPVDHHEEEGEKKGRGRPRKEKAEGEEGPKRGRGRPKKSAA